jgi:DNA processing protein
MDRRELLIGLHHIEGIGWKTIQKIVNIKAHETNMGHLDSEKWQEIGLKTKQIESLRLFFESPQVHDIQKKYNAQQITIITIYDEEYPSLLKEISQPPWVLYCKGNLDLFKKPLFAIVGTRSPTYYGKKIAEQYAEMLSQSNIGIVSGLARGIDRHAHIGSLRGNGKTIAVLGCAIDICYPPEHKSLHQQIVDDGLIISEYPYGTKIHVGMFPQRNRIIAGLSIGVLVVEAAAKSGSLITVDCALDENRDVFAIPGPITSNKSEGTHNLIKQGCKMVTCLEDILEEYTSHLPSTESKLMNTSEVELSPLEVQILHLLDHQPMKFDDLFNQCSCDIGTLYEMLFALINKKMIHPLPGFYYEKNIFPLYPNGK